MKRYSGADDFEFGGLKTFRFDYAFGAPVEGITGRRCYCVEGKQIHPVSGLLVRGEDDLNIAVRNRLIGHEYGYQSHDFGDASLIIGAEKGGSIGGYYCLADIPQ